MASFVSKDSHALFQLIKLYASNELTDLLSGHTIDLYVASIACNQ